MAARPPEQRDPGRLGAHAVHLSVAAARRRHLPLVRPPLVGTPLVGTLLVGTLLVRALLVGTLGPGGRQRLRPLGSLRSRDSVRARGPLRPPGPGRRQRLR